MPNLKIIVSVLALFLLVLALALLATLFSGIFQGLKIGTSRTLNQSWYAVHLANGQVYFGRLDSVSPETLTLSHTYFLEKYTAPPASSPGGETMKGNQFQIQSLTPRPQEIYNVVPRGQINEMITTDNTLYIDRRAVLFWEKLDSSSAVVKLIEKEEEKKKD